MSRRKTVTIFEGCDGSGKTTAAKAFAARTNARYVHLGPLPRVSNGLPRLYAEAILPAVLGYQDVVMDRSWLSEQPYGAVYRDGADRIGTVQRRMLERLALSCGALVVRADPGPEVCVATWLSRKGEEYLEKAEDVKAVNEWYRRKLLTELSVLDYDYTNQPEFYLPEVIDSFRPPCHLTEVASAGHLDAPVVLVGEAFGHVKDRDLLFQWPFASFSPVGCSWWVTVQLAMAGIPERSLCWVNADQPWQLEAMGASKRTVVALGQVASEMLKRQGVPHEAVGHPQHAMRFQHHEPYELVTLLKEILA